MKKGTVESTIMLLHVIPMTPSCSSYSCLHFVEERLNTWRGEILCPEVISLTQACWLPSHGSFRSLCKLPQKVFNRRKEHNMLGLFLLMTSQLQAAMTQWVTVDSTYFKEESPTPMQPRKLSFLRNPPHRFEIFSTTLPLSQKSQKKNLIFHAAYLTA